jgi:hypothetical protein
VGNVKTGRKFERVSRKDKEIIKLNNAITIDLILFVPWTKLSKASDYKNIILL